LQAQNQKLLGIVREMGAKMEAESEEREYREALENEQGEAVREVREAIAALKNNWKHSVMPTMLKSKRSPRSVTRLKRSSRRLSIIMSEKIHVVK
jgi:hypothetical protein